MLVACKVGECKYCSKNGFCTNPFLIITPQGRCGRIHDNKGFVRPDWNAEVRQKQQEERIEEIIDEEVD